MKSSRTFQVQIYSKLQITSKRVDSYWSIMDFSDSFQKSFTTKDSLVAVVVAQLIEWLLPTPKVRCSNPGIGKLLNRTFVY